jgi:hypothetical protein
VNATLKSLALAVTTTLSSLDTYGRPPLLSSPALSTALPANPAIPVHPSLVACAARAI